jgi:hypothetical protein
VKVTLVARPLLHQLLQSYAGSKTPFSGVEPVFVLEHYLETKSFVAVREAFSSVCVSRQRSTE